MGAEFADHATAAMEVHERSSRAGLRPVDAHARPVGHDDVVHDVQFGTARSSRGSFHCCHSQRVGTSSCGSGRRLGVERGHELGEFPVANR